jgi:hypothetical protein
MACEQVIMFSRNLLLQFLRAGDAPTLNMEMAGFSETFVSAYLLSNYTVPHSRSQ